MEFSSAEVRKVKKIVFGVLSPEKIRAMAACEIKYPETFENGHPKPHGLMDLRMGSVDRSMRCQSCGGSMSECQGHFGYIELAKPVYHYGFLMNVLKVLHCCCFHCSALLVDSSDNRFRRALKIKNSAERLREVHKTCAGINECSRCSMKQPKITREGLRLFFEPRESSDTDHALRTGGKKQLLAADKAHNILKKVSDDDCRAMGLNPQVAHPHWMIQQVVPVPPPCVRPTILMDTVSRGEDDLTHKLSDLLKANTNLRRQEMGGSSASIVNDFAQLLQYHLATLLDNEIIGQPQAMTRTGRPLKSIRQRLKGKGGRIRGNLMGKRVDFSARTVITPDPTISIDEVGVPRSIAQNLTFPETVTPYNIAKLRKLVDAGPSSYPGAKYIIRDDQERLDLRYLRKASDARLQYGYKVERHLVSGDIVIFNRQPSLHKMSMMGHRVKVMPYSTFRLNLSVCAPYNADFDGDEMNLHVPQSYETVAEAKFLSMVPSQIVSPQGNRPVMGIVQDALLGSSMLTRRDTFVDKKLLMNLLMWVDGWDGIIPEPAILKPQQLWTGKQVFSLVLPKINMMKDTSTTPPGENPFISTTDSRLFIENGTLLTGGLDKKSLGQSHGGIVHVAFNEFGSQTTKRLLNQIQQIVNQWLLVHGFSVGIGDTVADERTMGTINSIIRYAKANVQEEVTKFSRNKIALLPGRTMKESFENSVNKLLNTARDDAGSNAQKSLRRSNRMKCMVDAGSKGSFINISQMVACVGQQNVEGKRIPNGFADRTLPHFLKDDHGATSRGFVENSYLSGLTAYEFFFHAMGGREGVIDTAVKTSETGYIQRRLIKAMEDVTVRYDGTVRNAANEVIQFAYGEDGLDGGHMESQRLDVLRMSDAELNKSYYLNTSDLLATQNALVSADVSAYVYENEAKISSMLLEEYNQITEDRHILQTEVFPSAEAFWPLPCNIQRLIWNAQKTFDIDFRRPCDINPDYAIQQVRNLLARLVIVPGSDPISLEAQGNILLLFSILVRCKLAYKRLIVAHLSKAAFNWLLGEIEVRFRRAVVNPGEMVGPIAAQSIGEPATQMTLNTFHYAGVSSKNVTLGIPRLKEVINVAKKQKTPSMAVYIRDFHQSVDSDSAKRIQADLEHCPLRKVVAESEIIYDPDLRNTCVKEDVDIVNDFYLLDEEDREDEENISPWLLRLTFDKEMVVDKDLTLGEINSRILEEFGDEMTTVFSDDNAEKLIMRIRIRRDEDAKYLPASFFDEDEYGQKLETGEDDLDALGETDDVFLRKVERELLNEVCLKGIPGIRKVFMRQENLTVFQKDHSVSISQMQWVLDTEGTNLKQVLCHEQICPTRTTTNDIVETFDALGIEAVRAVLLGELRNVISFDGSYVNYRHLSILVDVMTYKGSLIAITRHGINRVNSGPLARASFEETVEQLLSAAVFGETDHLSGVSQNVMLGQLAPIGTGCFDLYLDTEGLSNAEMISSTVDETQMNSQYADYFQPQLGTFEKASPQHSFPDEVQFSPVNMASGFSPGFSPSSDIFQPQGVMYSPTVDSYSPGNPSYSPSSPSYSPSSPSYSPSSPSYSPSSPSYSPSSPSYSPSSPSYSPSSPSYSPSSPSYSPSSPSYSPSSPSYSPSSPSYSPSSPSYSPSSPSYSPSSPSYSPSSPSYSPSSPSYSPSSPSYSPSSPSYSPSSPSYNPSEPDTWK